MLPMNELNEFTQSNPSFKMLKPWWDALSDYLCTAMLLVAVITGAMQASKGALYCLPAIECNHAMSNQSITAFGNTISCKTPLLKANNSAHPTASTTVFLKLQNQGQYDFVNSECSNIAVHWFASYFSLIIFLQAVLFLLANNVFLKLPMTLPMMEIFTIMFKDLTFWYRRIGMFDRSKGKVMGISLKWIYFLQSLFKTLLLFTSIGLSTVYYKKLKKTVSCKLQYNFISETSENFECLNVLIPFFGGVHWIFLSLVILYGILSIGSLIWVIQTIREYQFVEKYFVLHLLRNYDRWYADKFERSICRQDFYGGPQLRWPTEDMQDA